MFPVKSRDMHMMTRTSETIPVLTKYDSCQSRSKLVTTGRTRVFTWIHMKTRTGGVVSIMNQYDTCQLVQKWFHVCWLACQISVSQNASSVVNSRLAYAPTLVKGRAIETTWKSPQRTLTLTLLLGRPSPALHCIISKQQLLMGQTWGNQNQVHNMHNLG